MTEGKKVIFNGIVKELKISINEGVLENVFDIDGIILTDTEKYGGHLSIFKIKKN